MARVHVDTWRTTYSGIVPADFLAGLSYADGKSRWEEILSTIQRDTCSLVAETDGGTIIGFAGGGPERQGDRTYRGEIYSVYVLPSHQRQGLGRRLVTAVVHQLLRDGIASMLLWVLEDNHPARRFYESLGGEQVGRHTTIIGGAELTEVSYGWKDLAPIT